MLLFRLLRPRHTLMRSGQTAPVKGQHNEVIRKKKADEEEEEEEEEEAA